MLILSAEPMKNVESGHLIEVVLKDVLLIQLVVPKELGELQIS